MIFLILLHYLTKIKYTNIFGIIEGTKTDRLVRSAQVAWPFCRHDTSWYFFSRGLSMPRGRKTSLTIRLTPAERRTLLAWQRATTIPAGLVRRGRILLLLTEGMTITDIATTVGISRRFVYKWVQRFVQEGLEGLYDKPGPGRRRVPLPHYLRDQPNNLDVG